MAARTRWWALAAVSLATLMTYLDNNVTNVALPTIERNLHVSVSGLEWIVSSEARAILTRYQYDTRVTASALHA